MTYIDHVISSEPKADFNTCPRNPPGTLPIFGNGLKFLLLDRQSLFDWFSEIHNDIFGFETYEISVPTLPPGIVINDPEVLDFVMKKEGIEGFGKGPFFEERSWHLFGSTKSCSEDSQRAPYRPFFQKEELTAQL